MMVRIRLAAAAASAGLVLAALAGCRLEAGSAAFVGPTRITDARVDEIVKQVQPHIREGQTGGIRQQVVAWLALGEAGRRYARAHNVTVGPRDLGAFAQQANLPAGLET
jgi:hypothetical protein